MIHILKILICLKSYSLATTNDLSFDLFLSYYNVLLHSGFAFLKNEFLQSVIRFQQKISNLLYAIHN